MKHVVTPVEAHREGRPRAQWATAMGVCVLLLQATVTFEAAAREPAPFQARMVLLEGTSGIAVQNTDRPDVSNAGLSFGGALAWRPKEGYAFPVRFQFGQIRWEERPDSLPIKWSLLTLALRVYVVDTSRIDFHVEPLSIGSGWATTPENQCSNLTSLVTQPALGLAWHVSPEFSLGLRLSYAFKSQGSASCTQIGGIDRRPVIRGLDVFDSSLVGTFHFGPESKTER